MKKFLGLFFFLLLLAGAGYVYFYYFNVYDSGNREGKIYSFSKAKGNIIKTAEGIMIQPGLRPHTTGGLNTNEFHFSVTDRGLADSLERLIGKTVIVHYVQYRKSLFWRGENNNLDNKENGQFIVDKIIRVEEARTPEPVSNDYIY